MKRFDVVTLFPEMFAALTQNGITGRAEYRGVYDLVCWNPREFATDPRKTIDDRPYGGGAGMVMMPAPLVNAIDGAKKRQLGSGVKASKTIYLSPQGRVLTQQDVRVMHIRGDGGVQTEDEVAKAEEFARTKGQRTLFDMEEADDWKSTQSGSRKKSPGDSHPSS